MKKIIFLFSFTFLILQSCSSGDNNSDETTANEFNSLLFRRWYFVSRTTNGSTYYPTICANNGHRDHVDFIFPNIANFYYITSSSGGNCSNEYALEPYTFTKNGNTLQMTYSNGFDPSTITISELTATTLKYVETWDTGSALIVYTSY